MYWVKESNSLKVRQRDSGVDWYYHLKYQANALGATGRGDQEDRLVGYHYRMEIFEECLQKDALDIQSPKSYLYLTVNPKTTSPKDEFAVAL